MQQSNLSLANEPLSPSELHEAWLALASPERVEGFRLLSHAQAEVFFLELDPQQQAHHLLALPPTERRLWMRLLEPDDAADVIQSAPQVAREALLALLDDLAREEVAGLLAYEEDVAGGLMNPRFARVRASMTVDEAVSYLRRQAQGHEHAAALYAVYVLDAEQRLLGVTTLGELFAQAGHTLVSAMMRRDVITIPEQMDQEAVSRLFASEALLSVPVVDDERRMRGVVTIEDIVDVVEEEATEDIQKLGGQAALSAPYLRASFLEMIRKRAGWLTVLFFGEMLTASAMAHFEGEIARAVVLALFIPLIISSGGNSGSQATTLIIRAMALDEIKLRDWWRVLVRELCSGLTLGVVLACVGFVRVVVWERLFHTYGEHATRLALTVGVSLVGIVTWGTVSGAMLPFGLKRVGFDPASASAPLVATLIDVTGLVIYFTAASLILRGTIL